MSAAADAGRQYLLRGQQAATAADGAAQALTGLLAVLVTAFEEEEEQRIEQDRKDSYDLEMEAGWRAAERVREMHHAWTDETCTACHLPYPCPTIQTLIGDGYPHDPTAGSDG